MKQENFNKGLLLIEHSISTDDRKNGVDAWFDGDIPVAIRKRPNLNISDYDGKVITIRISKPEFRGDIKFEYDKLMNGDFRSVLYIFRLKGHLILVSVKELTEYLRGRNINELEIHPNKTGRSDLVCISPRELNNPLILPLYTELI